VVGGAGWQDWMTSVSAHFTPADMRYFDVHNGDNAWAWAMGG